MKCFTESLAIALLGGLTSVLAYLCTEHPTACVLAPSPMVVLMFVLWHGCDKDKARLVDVSD